MMQNLPMGPAELLFELGQLRVFHYPTEDDVKNNAMPREVFWTDLVSQRVYGPFPSIHNAMAHYTHMVHVTKAQKHLDSLPDAQIIHVDFVNKRRLEFKIPGGET